MGAGCESLGGATGLVASARSKGERISVGCGSRSAWRQTCISHQLLPQDIADKILYAGKIVSVDQRGTIADALAMRNGRIIAVGSDTEVRKLAGPQTLQIDPGRRTVIPGLIDSHMHAIRDGLYYTTTLDWGPITSVAGALDGIRMAAHRAPPGGWIAVIGGWDKEQLAEHRASTPQELDEAAPDQAFGGPASSTCI